MEGLYAWMKYKFIVPNIINRFIPKGGLVLDSLQ